MEPAAEDMDNVSKACLSIFAITILAVAVGKDTGVRDEAALCDGRQYGGIDRQWKFRKRWLRISFWTLETIM